MLLDKGRFPILDWLERHAHVFQEEGGALTLEDTETWAEPSASTLPWKALPLVGSTAYHDVPYDRSRVLALAPRSVELLEGNPDIVTAGFSLLSPGAHILAHVDAQLKGTLRAHLGIVVPPESALRVGNMLLRWTEGETLLFDGQLDHEAGNASDRLRTVMLVDIKLSESQQAYVDEFNRNIDPRWWVGGAGNGLFTQEEVLSGRTITSPVGEK